MKKTMKVLSMAALVIVGALLMGCEGIEEIQQPQQKDNIVTQTTTICFSNSESTKALSIDFVNKKSVKSFAEGDQISVVYENTAGEMNTEIVELTVQDDDTKAKFTVSMVNPKPSGSLKYIYPAAMAKDNDVNYDALTLQDGTLATLASKFDLALFEGSLTDAGQLPDVEETQLSNPLAICAFTLKNSDGSSEINATVTSMSITDGTYSYAVRRTASADPIYVAMRPTSNANITIFVTDGSVDYVKSFTKTLSGKTYVANNVYPLGLRMTDTFFIFTVGNHNQVQRKAYIAKSNLQATYDGSTWTWHFAEHPWDYAGTDNNKINGYGTVSGPCTIDLFGWVGHNTSKSQLKTGVAQYGIANSMTNSEYGNNVNDHLLSDWGNTIGGDWLTPDHYDWNVLFDSRASGSTVNGTTNARYTFATINTDGEGINGIILFPNNVIITRNEATTWGPINGGNYYTTKCTSAQWTILETKGCVFLPAAGYRRGNSYNSGAGAAEGHYWSASPNLQGGNNPTWYAQDRRFFSGMASFSGVKTNRCWGGSVRLIRFLPLDN